MGRTLRGILGLLAAAGVLALLQPVPLGMADAVRDFHLCVQGCNDARALCNDQCQTDCLALFPGDENQAAKDACVIACKDACLAQSNACKLECQELKDGGYPPEP